jgi:hypothetical protein
MEEGCKTKFTEQELEIYVPEDIRDKFFKFRKMYKINVNPNLKWCPNNTCDAFIDIEYAKGDSIICSKC